MFRLITIEREYGCGGAPIAAQLADHLGWKLWDHRLTEEIARLEIVDRERIAFIKHYFNADWPTRSLYHLMLNTAVGNDAVIETILNTMHLVEGRPQATDYEPPGIPTHH